MSPKSATLKKLLLPLTFYLLPVIAMTACTPMNEIETIKQQSATKSPAPILDRELFFTDAEISYGQISPDGQYFSFLKPVNNIKNIWVKGVDDSFEDAYPITKETEQSIYSYFWSHDGQRVLYTMDQGGNENTHIFTVDPTVSAKSNAHKTTNLTPINGAKAMIYQVPKKTPEQIIIGLNDRDPQMHDVYRLDLNTGERNLLYENTQNLITFYFDLDGQPRLTKRESESGGFEILKIDDLAPIYSVEPGERVYFERFHPDGNKAYIYSNKDVNLLGLYLLDIETGDTTLVHSDPENEVDIDRVIISDINEEILAVEYLRDKRSTYFLNKKLEQDFNNINTQVPEAQIYLRGSTNDENLWLFVSSKDTDPGSIYLYDRNTEKVNLQYIARPELPMEHLTTMHPVQYPSRDGKTIIPAYLTLPKGVKAEKLPLVLYVHGGPHARDVWGYDAYAQFLANRGYAVLQPNFRGSDGFGKKFLNAGDREFGTGYMQHDLTDGVEFLVKEGIADPENVAIFGASYGGYAALAGATFTPDVYKAAISYVGPSNLETLLRSVPPYWRTMLSGWYRRVGNPDVPADLADMSARSPLYFADQIQSALMVIQGANDPRVKQQESDQIVAKMVELGRPVKYILAENEGHGFRQEDNRLASTVAVEQFLAEHLGGRFQTEIAPEIATKLSELTVDPTTVEVELVEGALGE